MRTRSSCFGFALLFALRVFGYDQHANSSVSDKYAARKAAERDYEQVSLKLIAAGQGTTATHAVYTLICEMGLVACHHRQCCNDEEAHDVRRANAQFVALYRLADVCVNNDASALRQFCGLTEDLQGFEGGNDMPAYCGEGRPHRSCCKKLIRETNMLMVDAMSTALGKFGCSVGKLMAELDDTMWRLITSGVEALVDTPTASFLSTFNRVAPKVAFRVVLTTRDPKTWAVKRVSEHGSADFLCRVDNGAGARLGDLQGCMEHVTSHSTEKPVLLSDAFVTLVEVSAQEREDEIRALQDTLAPELAVRMAMEGDSPVPQSRYGPWFMEMDFFDRTINREPIAAGDPSDSEAEQRNRFLELAREAFEKWWKLQ